MFNPLQATRLAIALEGISEACFYGEMVDPVSFVISLAALVVSVLTAWANLFRRGDVRLTKPAFIAFHYDSNGDRQPQAKIFIRALLYSTGKRGHVVENMYLMVRRGDTRQTFSIWGHGDERLSRGSGLFVGETGVAANHHFNPPVGGTAFWYLAGEYEIEIYATLPGKKTPLHLSTATVVVPESAHLDSRSPDVSVWFDWEPEAGCYHAHIETRQHPTSKPRTD